MTHEAKLEIDGIPHGHGLSFKKGISDALIGVDTKKSCHETHYHSYDRGFQFGTELKAAIASKVKD